jgi:hypothetical protein
LYSYVSLSISLRDVHIQLISKYYVSFSVVSAKCEI